MGGGASPGAVGSESCGQVLAGDSGMEGVYGARGSVTRAWLVSGPVRVLAAVLLRLCH